MSIFQKLHKIAGKIDPVVKWADKQNLTPTMFYPPEKVAPDPIRPVTEAGKARAAAEASGSASPSPARRRRASSYLGTGGSGLFGGGGG